MNALAAALLSSDEALRSGQKVSMSASGTHANPSAAPGPLAHAHGYFSGLVAKPGQSPCTVQRGTLRGRSVPIPMGHCSANTSASTPAAVRSRSHLASLLGSNARHDMGPGSCSGACGRSGSPAAAPESSSSSSSSSSSAHTATWLGL